MHAALLRPHELDGADREIWRTAHAQDPLLASPYFSLSFFEAAAAARRDTRVLRMETGEGVSFLPVQKGAFGHCRALGGPMGDHQAVIGAPVGREALQRALRQTGLGAFDHHGALATQPAFAGVSEAEGSWVCDLSRGLDAYQRERKKLGGNTARNIFASERKLGEAGAVAFRFDDRRPETFERLFAWKSAQYRESRHFDVFSVSWTRKLLHTLHEAGPDGDARGVVSSLELDGELVAAHFGLMGARAMHYWFPAYDPALSKLGPGNALLTAIMAELCRLGVTEAHLGPGDYRYKAALGSWQFPVTQGCVLGGGLGSRIRHAAGMIEEASRRLPLGRAAHWPAKAFRRIDTLAGFHGA